MHTLGRKNYLFVGSEAGGKSAAIAYTPHRNHQDEQGKTPSVTRRHSGTHLRLQNQSRR